MLLCAPNCDPKHITNTKDTFILVGKDWPCMPTSFLEKGLTPVAPILVPVPSNLAIAVSCITRGREVTEYGIEDYAA